MQLRNFHINLKIIKKAALKQQFGPNGANASFLKTIHVWELKLAGKFAILVRLHIVQVQLSKQLHARRKIVAVSVLFYIK